MPLSEAARIGEDYASTSGIWLGYYAEPRLIYTSTAFRATSSPISNRRSVHLGVDIFAAAGTTVRAPLGGAFHAVENRRGQLDYGGLVVLAHTIPTGEVFFSLYGHLHPNLCDRHSSWAKHRGWRDIRPARQCRQQWRLGTPRATDAMQSH